LSKTSSSHRASFDSRGSSGRQMSILLHNTFSSRRSLANDSRHEVSARQLALQDEQERQYLRIRLANLDASAGCFPKRACQSPAPLCVQSDMQQPFQATLPMARCVSALRTPNIKQRQRYMYTRRSGLFFGARWNYTKRHSTSYPGRTWDLNEVLAGILVCLMLSPFLPYYYFVFDV
jgi:hypothetical protein